MDKEVFWKLLEPVHQKAASFCQKLTGDRHAGEDLYQDGLLRAMRRFDSLNDKSAFRSWLFTIMVNTYRNSLRSYARRNKVVLTEDLSEQLVTSDPRDEQESMRWLHKVLSVLSREDKAIVVLHHLDGWTVPELSEMLRKPEGTIKTRLRRARRKMQKAIERSLPSPSDRRLKIESDYALQTSKATDN